MIHHILASCYSSPAMLLLSFLLFLLLLFVPLYLFFLLRILVSSSSSSASSNYGHNSHPLIGSLISFLQNSHRLIDWFTHLLTFSSSQTIVFKGLGLKNQMIVTANPTNVEHILKTNFKNYPKGKPLTDLLGDFMGVGIVNVDGELWSTQRKLASHEFSSKSLRLFVVSVLEEEVTKRLIPFLDNSIRNVDELDMQDVLRRFSFDTICMIFLGWDPFCLDYSRPVSPLATAFDVAERATVKRPLAPANWVWKLKRFLNVGSERSLKEAVRVVHSAVSEIIRERRMQMKGGASHGDLLSRFISAGHNDELVRDMVISFLIAGRDTTSSAMTWLLWLLTWHPTVERDVLTEITAMTNNHGNNSQSFDFEDLRKMDYLKACISMRLYPPVVWDSKHAEDDDMLPDGTREYKGNRVVYFPYGMGRMEALWGKDCLEFRPERWFTEAGELKQESPYKFPVFQGGPRMCLGKEMAFMQIKCVVASILRDFKIVPVCWEQPVYLHLMTALMEGGLKVKVHRRSAMWKVSRNKR